jgi:glycosyltransferase involved in cell wall biosynthesis
VRITYLHQYFVPPTASGGTRSYEFARRLVARGHEVTLITSSAMLPDGWSGRRRLDGVELVIIDVPYGNNMDLRARLEAFFRFAALASLEVTRHRADLVFATSTPLTIALPAICGMVWQRSPMVFEVRDLWPDVPIAMGALSSPGARAGARGLEWLAYALASRVVALSPGMAAGIRRRGIPAERVAMIPNASDVELFGASEGEGEAVRARLGLAADQPLVLYAGTFGRVNGVDYLVRLAARVRALDPNVRFVLAGRGALRGETEALARELGVLGETVDVVDPVPKRALPGLLAASSVATSTVIDVPALHHNSANKFFDALAAGRPIVINHEGWQADLIRQRGVGLVLPPEPTDVAAAALVDFLRGGELGSSGARALGLARERFDRDMLARQLADLLEQAQTDRMARPGRRVLDLGRRLPGALARRAVALWEAA